MALFSRSLIPSFALPSPATSLTDRLTTPSANSEDDSITQQHQPTKSVKRGLALLPAQPEEEEGSSSASSTGRTSMETGKSQTRRGRNSVVGKALFPSPDQTSSTTSTSTNTALKRLSLPNMVAAQHNKRATPASPRRKSLSPTHNASRNASLHPHSSSSREGSLLAEPLVRQLHALKSRNAVLESTLAAIQGEKSSVLSKATTRIASLEEEVVKDTTRIASLEQTVEDAVEEAEGWEAEAVKMGLELEREKTKAKKAGDEVDGLKQLCEEEKSKKKRYRELGVRLRDELVQRKLKEKWELAIIDAEDRSTDITMVGLEYDLAMLKLKTGLDEIRQEELKETIERQRGKLSEVSASRKLLLDSLKHSEETATALRADVARAQKDLTTEKDNHSATRNTLIQTQAALDALSAEMEEEREEKNTAVSALNDMEQRDKSGKKEEQKELAQVRKALEKERAARAKADADVMDLKNKLKQTQSELSDALKAAMAATLAAETATRVAEIATKARNQQRAKAQANPKALPSVRALASRKRRSLTHDGSDPVEDAEIEDEDTENSVVVDEANEIEDIEEPEEEEVVVKEVPPVALASLKAKPSAARAVRKVRSKPALLVEPEPEDEEVSQEVYNPVKSRSRSRSAPGPRPISRAATSAFDPSSISKKRKAAEDPVVVDSEDAPPVPSIPPPSSWVLKDKSANVKRTKPDPPPELVPTKKQHDTVDYAETEVGTEDGKGDEPAKKKKRKLFGGPKKFNWGALENTQMNSLGLPAALSPIKTDYGRPSILGLAKGPVLSRPSIFD